MKFWVVDYPHRINHEARETAQKTTSDGILSQRFRKSLCLACGMSLQQQPIHRFAAHLLFDFWANTAPTPSAGQVLPPAGGGGHNHTATPPPKPHALHRAGGRENSRSQMIRLQSAPHTTRLCCTLIYLATHNMHKPHAAKRLC